MSLIMVMLCAIQHFQTFTLCATGWPVRERSTQAWSISRRMHELRLSDRERLDSGYLRFVHSSCPSCIKGWFHRSTANAFTRLSLHGMPHASSDRRIIHDGRLMPAHAPRHLEENLHCKLAPITVDGPNHFQSPYCGHLMG